MLLDLAKERGAELAVDDGMRQRSFAELLDRSHRFAHFLRHDVGLAPGDHLSLLMSNRVEVIELLLGAVLLVLRTSPIWRGWLGDENANPGSGPGLQNKNTEQNRR